LATGQSPTPPVATRSSRFRQFVDRFRQNPVKNSPEDRKNFPKKNKVTNSGGPLARGVKVKSKGAPFRLGRSEL
jgi:hypothetical protein